MRSRPGAQHQSAECSIASCVVRGHTTGFSTSQAFNKEKVTQDWISWNCQQLGLPIPHLLQFKDHSCTCDRFAIDEYGDHLHSCTQHAGATTGAHEHILTAVQRLFHQAGFANERKNVPHSRGMKKADLHVKDFRLEGIRDVIHVDRRDTARRVQRLMH